MPYDTAPGNGDAATDNSPSRASPAPAFTTDFLGLAAFLTTQGHEPTLQPISATKVLFAFAPTPRLQTDVAAFHTGTAIVEPAAYDAARVRLRKRVDALLRGGR